jgi:hypothetical protein
MRHDSGYSSKPEALWCESDRERIYSDSTISQIPSGKAFTWVSVAVFQTKMVGYFWPLYAVVLSHNRQLKTTDNRLLQAALTKAAQHQRELSKTLGLEVYGQLNRSCSTSGASSRIAFLPARQISRRLPPMRGG